MQMKQKDVTTGNDRVFEVRLSALWLKQRSGALEVTGLGGLSVSHARGELFVDLSRRRLHMK